MPPVLAKHGVKEMRLHFFATTLRCTHAMAYYDTFAVAHDGVIGCLARSSGVLWARA